MFCKIGYAHYFNVLYLAYACLSSNFAYCFDFQCLHQPQLSRKVVLFGNLRRILQHTTDSSMGGQQCQTVRLPAWSHQPAWQLTPVLAAVCCIMTSVTWQQLIPCPAPHTSSSSKVVCLQLHKAHLPTTTNLLRNATGLSQRIWYTLRYQRFMLMNRATSPNPITNRKYLYLSLGLMQVDEI